MSKLLVIVDMQNDFIDGALGTPEAQAIVPAVIEKIKTWDGDVVATQDTHKANYLQTNEGKHLPVEHCMQDTTGWKLHPGVQAAIENKPHYLPFEKGTFGSMALAQHIRNHRYNYIELVGLCTDICVVTNALLIKTYCPEKQVVVDASCCAGVTPTSHRAALITMKQCQVDVIGVSAE